MPQLARRGVDAFADSLRAVRWRSRTANDRLERAARHVRGRLESNRRSQGEQEARQSDVTDQKTAERRLMENTDEREMAAVKLGARTKPRHGCGAPRRPARARNGKRLREPSRGSSPRPSTATGQASIGATIQTPGQQSR